MLDVVDVFDTYNNEKFWGTDDGLMLLQCWVRDGCLIKDIINKMGISRTRFNGWRQRNPKIDEALSVGKEITDYKVENALFKCAVGYQTVETKVSLGEPDKQGNRRSKKERTIKEVGPNPVACLAWLNNRKPNEWKRNRDNVLDLNDDDRSINIRIVRASEADEVTVEAPEGIGDNDE